MIKKYELCPTTDGSVIAYREGEDIDGAEDIEWCRASDVDAYMEHVEAVIEAMQDSLIAATDRICVMEEMFNGG